MVQSYKSGRAFRVGPGSSLSLSKYFGHAYKIFLKHSEQRLFTTVTSVSEVIVIFLQLILFANTAAFFYSLLGLVSLFLRRDSGEEISTGWRRVCFSGQAQVVQKSLMIKKQTLNTVKNFRANSVSQDKRKLLKNSECKKYIPYSETFQGNSVVQGKRKLLKNPECKKYFQYRKKFLGNSIFQGKRRCCKILSSEIYIQCSENFQGNR